MKNIGYNPVLTTLIKLNFITMKEPDKWCIKVTPENKKAIEKWRTANVTLNGRGYCVNKTFFDDSSIGYWYPDKPNEYTEISFEEFKVYTSKPKDLTGRYVKCLVDRAQGTNCKAGEIYKLVSLDNIVETQIYAIENGFIFHISPIINNAWELLPEDYSINKPLKQAVYCETQEEWDFACDKYDKEKRVKTEFGKEYNTFNYTSSFRGWNTKEYYIEENYQILSFQEWCDLNGYKMEKSKQEILKEFAKKYPPGTKVKSPDGVEFIISTTYKYKGENNDFLQGSPYYIGLCGVILAVKENSSVREYLYKDGKYAEIIKDAPKFEVGKWYSFNWDWRSSNSTIIAKIKEINEDSFSISWRSYLWRENDYSISDRYSFRDVSNIKELSIEEIQQYLPEGHPDKIKSNQEFKVGDWVVVLEEDGFYINSEKCPQKLIGVGGYGLPYRLLFKDGHTNNYEKIRHATEKEMQEYFRNNEDLLKKEIEAKTNGYFNEILDRMEEGTPKSSCHLLSVDDEELPMVNIIKTNSLKQLLNND